MRSFFVLALALATCVGCNSYNGYNPNGGGGDDGSGGGGSGGGGSNGGGGGGGSNGGGGGGGSGSDGSGGGGGSGSGVQSSDLVFAVVGDTRPPNEDDTSGYPTSIIDGIFSSIANTSPAIQFVVGTGDYQYANPTGSTQQAQLNLYNTARQKYSGPYWPGMGNHECTGYTASNCGTGNTDGVTKNMTDWMTTFLTPIGVSTPYYTETVSAKDNSWNAKFIFIACNAWDSAQSSWLSTQLSQQTTYTFIVRHEPDYDMSSAPCSQSQTLIAATKYTLLVTGHTHEYSHPVINEIVNGLGGAPLGTGTQYGYTIITRNSDGTITVNTVDYTNGSSIDSFKLNADGTGA